MSHRGLSQLVCPFRVLEGLPGMLVSSLIFRFPLLFTGAMGVGRKIMQFGSPLMIFIMRSVVISCGHNQRVSICPDLLWASLASL